MFFTRKNDENDTVKKDSSSIKMFLKDILVALCIFSALYFTIELDIVVGESMKPTLNDGNVYVGLKVNRNTDYGRIVTVNIESKGVKYTKRIIGKEGDTIDLIDGIVYRNGVALDEPYVSSKTYATGDVVFPITVPDDCYFVLGDNRGMSMDSRFSEVGMIQEDDVDASYLFLLPWTR